MESFSSPKNQLFVSHSREVSKHSFFHGNIPPTEYFFLSLEFTFFCSQLMFWRWFCFATLFFGVREQTGHFLCILTAVAYFKLKHMNKRSLCLYISVSCRHFDYVWRKIARISIIPVTSSGSPWTFLLSNTSTFVLFPLSFWSHLTVWWTCTFIF